MNEHLKDWRIHALAFVLTLIAEFIGTQKFAFGPLAFSLIPMLYVLIFGAILGGIKVLPHDMMEEASPYIGISVMMLTAKIAMSVGPNLEAVINAGPALIFQEFGNLGTAFLALPIAIGVFHMGRAAVGCCFSISREGSLAIIADKYGLDSEEGIGVMGGVYCRYGTWNSVLRNSGILPDFSECFPSVFSRYGLRNWFCFHDVG